jgi:hypothetical protein
MLPVSSVVFSTSVIFTRFECSFLSLEVLVSGSGWAYRHSCLTPRMDAAGVSVSDSFLLSGGQSPSGDVLDSVEFYRPEVDEWQAGPCMLVPRYGHGVVAISL